MIIRHQIRKIGIRRGQVKLNLCVGQLAQVLHRRQQRCGGRGRLPAHMQRHGFKHVIGAKGFAVVKSHILAQIKCPDPRIRAGLPAFRQFTAQRPVRADLGQAIEHHAMGRHHHEQPGMSTAIPRVIGKGATHGGTQYPALTRRSRQRHARGRQHTGGGTAGQKATSAYARHLDAPFPIPDPIQTRLSRACPVVFLASRQFVHDSDQLGAYPRLA